MLLWGRFPLEASRGQWQARGNCLYVCAGGQKTLPPSGVTRDDLFPIACLSRRATLSSFIACMSTLIPGK